MIHLLQNSARNEAVFELSSHSKHEAVFVKADACCRANWSNRCIRITSSRSKRRLL